MRNQHHYNSFLFKSKQQEKLLAVLIDPEKFTPANAATFIATIPKSTTHLFVGGSTVADTSTHTLIVALKKVTALPVFIFPGAANQVSQAADALLFLSLLSGRNPEYLIGQQVLASTYLRTLNLETIATAYLLIDGGHFSAVQRVTNTKPMSQNDIDLIVNTALAGALMGAKLVYLEAGSGAIKPVDPNIIAAVKNVVDLPIIVGGGIKTESQKLAAYRAGANMVVMGTVFEK